MPAPFRVVTPGRAPGLVVGWLASWRLEGKTVGPGFSGRSLGLRTERPRNTIPEFERSFERAMKRPPRSVAPVMLSPRSELAGFTGSLLP